ncbi:MAG: glucose-1-phosphate thymidylyltransferase RfbA [Elusimicrobia bacterium]|nr:glucose-1-phosphate thymidylyltransferase RfbA [Elusimicrobiota bacterium]
MKGIILAGGSGTRLYPITMGVCKQLLPIYDKPMIYYPISALMLAGIKEILIISTPKDLPRFKDIFQDGSHLGLKLSYKEQPSPNGLAEAFILGKEFLGGGPGCLVLGDNIFYGHGFTELLDKAIKNIKDNKATVFGYYVNDPERYGVVELDKGNNAITIEEKPKKPKSNWAVIGLYFYPSDVCSKAGSLKPSARGELEITDLNLEYLKERRLKVEVMGRGYAWLDTGTYSSLLEAGEFIETIERRQGLKIGCLEEIAYKKGFISKEQLLKLADKLNKNSYGEYLLKIASE